VRPQLRATARALIAALLLLTAWSGLGSAQTVREGTELLLTTPDSQRIVGHGLVSGGHLTVNLDPEFDEFIALLLDPAGGFEVVSGFRAEDHLRLIVDGRTPTLQAFLAVLGIDLSVQTVDSAFRDPLDPDDDRLGPSDTER
jgi:hypothetical protein